MNSLLRYPRSPVPCAQGKPCEGGLIDFAKRRYIDTACVSRGVFSPFHVISVVLYFSTVLSAPFSCDVVTPYDVLCALYYLEFARSLRIGP
ncbi:hypothetical protein LshimejAT787_0506770 [Lyophyllum shimeji]|uniref:Uncharacterized protein n=1 Tax=Lyophyllum shimeji TaxID=47721 RepID=A0A9P3PM14_LYOSH|nr:hypothetical protein LshimejAT787_0506770 [Lyophyllum shimeji]